MEENSGVRDGRFNTKDVLKSCTRVSMLLSETIDYQTKRVQCQTWNTSFQVVDQRDPRDSWPRKHRLLFLLVTCQNLVVRLYCWRNHILWPQDMGKPTWKFSPYRLDSVRRCYAGCWVIKTSVVLPSCKCCKLQKQAAWWNVSICEIVVWRSRGYQYLSHYI